MLHVQHIRVMCLLVYFSLNSMKSCLFPFVNVYNYLQAEISKIIELLKYTDLNDGKNKQGDPTY